MAATVPPSTVLSLEHLNLVADTEVKLVVGLGFVVVYGGDCGVLLGCRFSSLDSRSGGSSGSRCGRGFLKRVTIVVSLLLLSTVGSTRRGGSICRN